MREAQPLTPGKCETEQAIGIAVRCGREVLMAGLLTASCLFER